MNWNELQDFINTLSEEQLEYEVLIIDQGNDIALEVFEAEITDEVTYSTFNGTIPYSATVDYSAEEKEDLEDMTYLKIDSETPYLIAE